VASGVFALFFFGKKKDTFWRFIGNQLTHDNRRGAQRYPFSQPPCHKTDYVANSWTLLQLVREDILCHLPVIGEYFVKEIPPEDNPF
jgi:hypothetical protein